MLIREIINEDGRIVKGVNTTQDVKPGEIQRQAKKFGNKLDKNNQPPLLHPKARKNSTPHVLNNLGLTEKIYKPDPDQTLGVPRDKMPQIKQEHYDELIDYLDDHGGKHVNRTIHARELKPVQKEFSKKGVKKMIKRKKNDTEEKPLIVSRDNYIVDGHHRWLAAYNLNETLPIMQFNIPIKRLMKLLYNFDQVSFKDIYEEFLRNVDLNVL